MYDVPEELNITVPSDGEDGYPPVFLTSTLFTSVDADQVRDIAVVFIGVATKFEGSGGIYDVLAA